MKKTIVYVLIAVVAIAAFVWKLKDNKKVNASRVEAVASSNAGAIPVLTEKISLTSAERQFSANGNFQAVQQLDFSAETPGRITRLYVKEGSVVKAGQVLAEIDNRVASADLQSAQATLRQAELDYERFQKAFRSGGVSQKQVDDMKIQLEAAQARNAQAGKISGNTRLTAPISGVINQKYVETGTYLSAGNKLFEIVDVSKMKLVVNVPEAQVIHLREGQKVSVRSDVFPEARYEGKITFVAVKGDGALNYPVEIEIPNREDHTLKAGMYGTASFDMPVTAPVLYVPRSAFYNGVNSGILFVLEEGHTARSRHVVTGAMIGDRVEVREGLQDGETVIISGQINLTDGSEVAPRNEQSPGATAAGA